jgi:hypothetical protein
VSPAGWSSRWTGSSPLRPPGKAQRSPPPLVFDGSKLGLNLDCSAMGTARMELQDAGAAIAGLTLADADVL